MRYQLTNIAQAPLVHYDRKRHPVHFNPGESKVIDIEEQDAEFITERALCGLSWKIEPAPDKKKKPEQQAQPVDEGPLSRELDQVEQQQQPEPKVARGKAYDKVKKIKANIDPAKPQENIHFKPNKAAANLLDEIEAGIGFFSLRKRCAGLVEIKPTMTKADIVAALKELAGG